MGPLAAAGIAAGSALLQQGAQAYATGKMNSKNRSFAEKMMHRQRDWALSDYAMQNEYNSPQAQMRRLKEAGLNPNLVYGNGSATEPSAQVRSTDTAKYAGEAPSFAQNNIGAAGIAAYQDATTRNLSNDLLAKQIAIAEREAQNKETLNQAMQLGITDKTFDLEQKVNLAPYNSALKKGLVEMQSTQIQKLLADMDLNTGRYNREGTKLASDLSTAEWQRKLMHVSANKSTEEIRKIGQEIENMKKTGKFQDFTNNLNEEMGRMNMTSTSGDFFKFLAAIADKLSKK